MTLFRSSRTQTATLSPPTLRDGYRWRGMRVGLLGGSFNPAHAGHLHIARLAMARFSLDAVWWIVTPQSPLKEEHGTAPYAQRYQGVETLIRRQPKMVATHLEDRLDTRYTFETVQALRKHFPHTDFLWICGTDNAHIFHRWDRWRALADSLPIVFIARPPARTLVRSCPLRLYARRQFFDTKGLKTDLSRPGIYWLKGMKMLDISSTKLRKENKQAA